MYNCQLKGSSQFAKDSLMRVTFLVHTSSFPEGFHNLSNSAEIHIEVHTDVAVAVFRNFSLPYHSPAKVIAICFGPVRFARCHRRAPPKIQISGRLRMRNLNSAHVHTCSLQELCKSL